MPKQGITSIPVAALLFLFLMSAFAQTSARWEGIVSRSKQIKDGDRVICLGFYNEKGEFQAVAISKRLSQY